MTGAQFRDIRRRQNLSFGQLADVLRIANPTLLRQMENGAREVTGPIAAMMALIDNGILSDDNYRAALQLPA